MELTSGTFQVWYYNNVILEELHTPNFAISLYKEHLMVEYTSIKDMCQTSGHNHNPQNSLVWLNLVLYSTASTIFSYFYKG